MGTTGAFWPAFWFGVAAPAYLYAPASPYAAYIYTATPAQNFAVVGGYLSQATNEVLNDRRTDTKPAGA